MNDYADMNSIPDLSSRKVLIVEDVESNYKLLEAILKPTKAQIVWFDNGPVAIEYFKSNDNIDIVLMDIHLPGMNGREITKVIKELKSEVPVIAQTAYAMTGDKEKCLEAGCDDYITKPITRAVLLDVIIRHLKIK